MLFWKQFRVVWFYTSFTFGTTTVLVKRNQHKLLVWTEEQIAVWELSFFADHLDLLALHILLLRTSMYYKTWRRWHCKTHNLPSGHSWYCAENYPCGPKSICPTDNRTLCIVYFTQPKMFNLCKTFTKPRKVFSEWCPCCVRARSRCLCCGLVLVHIAVWVAGMMGLKYSVILIASGLHHRKSMHQASNCQST